jgi:glycosyltransferase involved in cell wall biosynthesis
MKVLFTHNSYTWYREPLFLELEKRCDINFLFTKIKKSGSVYEGIMDKECDINLRQYRIIENRIGIAWGLFSEFVKADYDVAVITVVDDVKQAFEAILSAIIAKIRRKRTVYFWEHWDCVDVCFLRKQLRNKKLLGKERLSVLKKLRKYYQDRIFFRMLRPFIEVFIAAGERTKEFYISNKVSKDRIILAKDSSEVEKGNLEQTDIDNKKTDKLIILYFGRIVQYKGLEILIRAFARLEKEGCNAQLLICGDGPDKKSNEMLAENLGLKNVRFDGFVNPDKRFEYYGKSDIFVLPNISIEAWGLTINEAMQFGLPIVATKATGAAADLVEDGKNGFYIEENNVEELYNALKRLIADDEFRISAGMLSKEKIREFSYENMANQFMEAFIK